MEQNLSKPSKEEQREEETYEEEPFEEEPIEEEEEEPIEEEPFEEEPIEEEPLEEEPIEEEPLEEEPIEEEPLLEEEPINQEPFEENPIKEESLEEEPIEEEPLEEIVQGNTEPKQVDSTPVNSKKRKRVRWSVDLVGSAADSSAGSSITEPSILVPKAVDATTLFVRYLPLSMDTSSLVELFQPFGRISNAKVIIDKETSFSKGYGFVSFADPAHAAKAVACMNGYKIGSHIISVKMKELDEANLIVEDLPPGVDACRLAKMFSPFGHVTDAVVKKGFGFVKFSNANDAAQAVANMDGCMVDGHIIHVRVFGTSPDPRPGPQCSIEASKGIDMANLYVGNLPQNLKTDGLIQLFIRFGSIEKATVVMDKTTGLSRGYGLVKFATVAHAADAMKNMNGYVHEGKELCVSIARFGKQIDEANLYVGFLPLYINKKSLCNLFERFGPIVEAKVVMDEATGVSKGYGFVRFADPAHAAKAVARMNGLTIEENTICVRVAGVVPEHALNTTTQITTEGLKQRDEANLYISNIPASLETSGLVKLFERFGPVVQAKVINDKITGISKCSGFVRFSDAGHAVEAIKVMNGSLVEGKVIAVRIADAPGNHLAYKPGSLVNGPGCPSGSTSSHLVPFVYGPSLSMSMATQAQFFPWCTFPGLWSYQNELLVYGSDQWVYGPDALSSIPIQPFLTYGAPVNGGNDMPLHGLNSSDVIPTPDDLRRVLREREMQISRNDSTTPPVKLPIMVPASPIEHWVDSSFSFPAEGGFAFVIKACTTLLRFGASASRVFSAYHMEALALLTGIRSVLELNHQTGCFYTDSQVHERAYKDDHVVNVRSLMHNGICQAKGDETFEGKKELEMIEEEIAKIEDHLSPLRCIGGLEKINSIYQLEGFEKS